MQLHLSAAVHTASSERLYPNSWVGWNSYLNDAKGKSKMRSPDSWQKKLFLFRYIPTDEQREMLKGVHCRVVGYNKTPGSNPTV